MRKSLVLSLATFSLVSGCDGVEVAPSAAPSVLQQNLIQAGPDSSSSGVEEEGKPQPPTANYCSILRPCIWNPGTGRLEWATPSTSEGGKPQPPTANYCPPRWPCAWNPTTGRLESLTSTSEEGKPQPPTANLCRPGAPCAWNPTTGQLESVTPTAGEGKPQPPTANLCRPGVIAC